MAEAGAIFDVDGTLVRGGTERLFFYYLVRRKKLKPARAFGFLMRLAAAPHSRFRDKTYLAGMKVAELQQLSRRCFQEVIRHRLRSAGVACVQGHQAEGRKIVLLTGSLAFLVLPLKEHLAADWLIATELAQHNGYFTGTIRGLHPRGENKRLLLEELAWRHGLDLSGSFAYGDHEEDVPLLGCVGQPVAVNPTRTLQRMAQTRRWPIRYF
jgi:HAD superfamily hydrolase (TIGR01490 family)